MADVIFEEDQDTVKRPPPKPKKISATTGGPMAVVYKMGLAKSKTGANVVLVATIILCILLSAGVLVLSGVIQLQ